MILGRFLERPKTIYVLLALTIMLPMLLPGYIFALDMSFTPELRMPDEVRSSYPFYALLHALNWFIPSQIIQKVMLFGILFLSGYGCYRLIRALQQMSGAITDYRMVGALIGGALYMINPFTYSRFMTGQFAVLLGYALVPFFVTTLITLVRRPRLRYGAQLALWASLICIVSIHSAGLISVLGVGGLVSGLWVHRAKPEYSMHLFRSLAVALGLVFIANSYWIAPLVSGEGSLSRSVNSFTVNDQTAFATTGHGVVNKVANVLQLQGFWADSENLYALPQDVFPLWPLVVLLWWAVIGLGIRVMWKQRQRSIALFFIGTGLAAIIFATTNILPALSSHIEILSGYREPHKFIALLALSFAVFAGYAIAAVLGRYHNSEQANRLSLAWASALLVPVLLTPTMFWAFGGQLTPKNYPADWEMINSQLNQDKGKGRVVFLPWHQYIQFGFTDRLTVNPASDYFDRETLVSNELEYRGASPTTPDPEKQAIGAILQQADSRTDLAAKLSKYHIKYILLDREDDYKTYNYLPKQKDLRLIGQTTHFDLYRNETYKEET
jgi:hypothetical protein